MNGCKFGEIVEKKLSHMPIGTAFRMLAGLWNGTEYVGGTELFMESADCSGTVCGPLLLLGYNVRVRAIELYNEIFTIPVQVTPSIFEDPERIFALFCITREKRDHYGMYVEPGYVTHVAPVVGRYVVLNASSPGAPTMPITTSSFWEYFNSRGYDVVWRELNRSALFQAHERGDRAWGVDNELRGIL